MAHWQKRLRFAIALFVVIFAAVVVVSMRNGRQRATTAPPPKKLDEKAAVQTTGSGSFTRQTEGKTAFSIKFGTQATYEDGRSKFGGGVTVELPDKNGRRITIHSQDAEVTTPPGKQVGTVVFSGGVTLITSDGITVSSPTATYNDAEQMARIPGPVTFKKGRMTGSGIGATYDQARHVLWLLEQAKVDVAPDKQGAGAVHADSKAAGMARAEHYMKFQGDAHLKGEGHEALGDDVTAFLTQDDERMTRLELRGHSRITSKPGSGGPQDMRAKDIDLAYAEDGRTLQSARLVENASLQLPGEKGKAGRRIAGKAIDVALAPDGTTVTNLTATENVQVDLPADGETPARRIRAASLLATGAPNAGIQAATFSGDVEYRESRAARGKLTAIDRTARSARMDLKTKPGFGDIEQASFHTNVHFTDGTQTTADSPTAIYQIAQDRLDLSPEAGDTGRGPHVSDGRISVEARTIQMTLGTQAMKADTNVRSVMLAQSKKQDGVVKVPSIMKQDQPVNVKSNRLNYDGANSLATYEGNSRLWQEDTVIQADKIVLEDKTGNLHATTKVFTSMVLTEAQDKNEKPAKPVQTEPTNTTADELLYEDAKHRATYTGNTHMSGPDGDVTSDKLELYLAEQGGQLQRAEADGNVVSRQELRRAYGRHLTYVAKDEEYKMVGSPVKVYDDTPGNCRVTEGAVATFHSTGGTGATKQGKTSTSSVSGSDAFPHKSGTAVCGAGPGSH
ncbi:MAG TPA: LptA/OstA family protein [Vicinamibacterales bacterium]|nr:LptA/OstA family protein [Vicinamibacterales bacterium]